MLNRRDFAKRFIFAGTSSVVLSHFPGLASAAAPSRSVVRDFGELKAVARDLAARPYDPPRVTTSAYLRNLTPDQFQQIRFLSDRALWRGQSDFEVHYLKPGVYANDLVELTETANGSARPIPYDLSDFDLSGLPPLPQGTALDDALHAGGFAGFKVLYPLHEEHHWKDELIVFRGASYFRFLGRHQQYGLSARGIAINTALPRPEEFPDFRSFWLERPEAGAQSLRILALLDGPSVCGAYRFTVSPDDETTVEVEAELILRNEVEKFGCAPLTSMYLYGDAERATKTGGAKPKVHDSDGLFMRLSDGKTIWRPLAKRRGVTVTQHFAENPMGFGLLQREKDPDAFATPDKRYHLRPGYWVEPLDAFGKGHVQLVEIGSEDVDFDNIGAFWVPDEPPPPGTPFRLHYRLTSVHENPPMPAEMGYAKNSHIIPLDFGNKRPYLRAAVQFRGVPQGDLEGATARVSSPHGQTTPPLLKRTPDGALELTFDLQSDNAERAETFAWLERNGQPFTETWSYLWTV
ncbi:glucan biosynthesis protein [Hwanghaeella sp.]|uniref:glucan biosynthesis protein n=1 Tax=Hwanghaeella sp. TaxID=2605943 RepID=UPI003CCBEA7B